MTSLHWALKKPPYHPFSILLETTLCICTVVDHVQRGWCTGQVQNGRVLVLGIHWRWLHMLVTGEIVCGWLSSQIQVVWNWMRCKECNEFPDHWESVPQQINNKHWWCTCNPKHYVLILLRCNNIGVNSCWMRISEWKQPESVVHICCKQLWARFCCLSACTSSHLCNSAGNPIISSIIKRSHCTPKCEKMNQKITHLQWQETIMLPVVLAFCVHESTSISNTDDTMNAARSGHVDKDNEWMRVSANCPFTWGVWTQLSRLLQTVLARSLTGYSWTELDKK